jgi:hypothetical protein
MPRLSFALAEMVTAGQSINESQQEDQPALGGVGFDVLCMRCAWSTAQLTTASDRITAPYGRPDLRPMQVAYLLLAEIVRDSQRRVPTTIGRSETIGRRHAHCAG